MTAHLLESFFLSFASLLASYVLTRFEGITSPCFILLSLLTILATPLIFNSHDLAQLRMQPESVWKWLDAVDQDHLDPLDQWGVPTSQAPTQRTSLKSDNVFRDRDEELPHGDPAIPVKPTPPSGLLLRTGNIRMIGSSSSSDADKKDHSKLPIPGSPTTGTVDVKRKPCPQPMASTNMPIRRKRLPTYFEKAHTDALQTIPVIQVEEADPVAVEGQGARVVGESMPSKTSNSRRHTTAAGEGALQRSNAIKRQPNIYSGSRSRRIK